MRSYRVSAAGIALLVLMPLVTVACASSGPVAPPRSVTASTGTPVFTSREEAETQLRAAYARYLDDSSAVYRDGGEDLERLRPLVTAGQWQRELDGLEEFRAVGARSTGSLEVTAFVLQSARLQSGEAAAYACIDVGDTRLLDADGNDVTPSSRSMEGTVELSFDGLLLDGSEPWNGTSVC